MKIPWAMEIIMFPLAIVAVKKACAKCYDLAQAFFVYVVSPASSLPSNSCSFAATASGGQSSSP